MAKMKPNKCQLVQLNVTFDQVLLIRRRLTWKVSATAILVASSSFSMNQDFILRKSFSTDESFAVFNKCPIDIAYIFRIAGFRSVRPKTNAAKILPVYWKYKTDLFYDMSVWPDGYIICLIFGHLKQWTFAQYPKKMPKWVRNYAKWTIKCMSKAFKILPNLVTLDVNFIALDDEHCVHD